MARNPLIRTKTAHDVPKGIGESFSAILYFDNIKEDKNELRPYRGEIGSVVFPIDVLYESEPGKFVPVRGVSPIHTEYKMATYMSRFGDQTIAEFHADKAQLMIEEIAFYSQHPSNTQFPFLTVDDLEIYEPPAV